MLTSLVKTGTKITEIKSAILTRKVLFYNDDKKLCVVDLNNESNNGCLAPQKYNAEVFMIRVSPNTNEVYFATKSVAWGMTQTHIHKAAQNFYERFASKI